MVEAILGLCVLLASVVVHENAHGVVALALGDNTAKSAGRLTLNPVKHFDIVGSLILPAMMYFSTGGMFGYAKPVPVNPMKLQGKDRWGFALVAAAGPASNLLIALVAATLAVVFYDIPGELLKSIARAGARPTLEIGLGRFILITALLWNILLAAFNLLPIPPLDGSRLLRVFLSQNGRHTLDRIEPFGFLILLLLIVWLGEPLFRIVGLIEAGLLRLLPI